MSMYGDNGAHLVEAMRRSEGKLASANALTVESILEVYGSDPETLARALVAACVKIAQLERDIAYDYWPGA